MPSRAAFFCTTNHSAQLRKTTAISVHVETPRRFHLQKSWPFHAKSHTQAFGACFCARGTLPTRHPLLYATPQLNLSSTSAVVADRITLLFPFLCLLHSHLTSVIALCPQRICPRPFSICVIALLRYDLQHVSSRNALVSQASSPLGRFQEHYTTTSQKTSGTSPNYTQLAPNSAAIAQARLVDSVIASNFAHFLAISASFSP